MSFQSFTLFSSLKVHFRWKSILLWVQLILSIKACDAIRPVFNCFISMIISVDTLCGFAPLPPRHLTPKTGGKCPGDKCPGDKCPGGK